MDVSIPIYCICRLSPGDGYIAPLNVNYRLYVYVRAVVSSVAAALRSFLLLTLDTISALLL